MQVNWKKFYMEYDNQDRTIHLNLKSQKNDQDTKDLLRLFKQLERNSRPYFHKKKFEKFSTGSAPKVGFLFQESRANFNNGFGLFGSFDNPFNNPDSKKQRAAVKMRYGKSKQVHRKFLEEYMCQKNEKDVKEKPVLFGNVSKEQYKKKMVSDCFKWILSPDRNLNEEQLKTVATAFIARCEQYLGKKLNWQAAVHQNTEHNHLHILINGADQNGQRFKFPKKFVKKEVHNITSELLTNMLGERTEQEIKIAKEKRFTAERFTDLDKFILQSQAESKNKNYPTEITAVEPSIVKRLEFLEEYGLAKYNDGKYLLEENWDDTLRNQGRYNTFAKAKRDYKYNGRKLKMYTSEIGTVKGKVTKRYAMNDEDIWNNAIIINDDDGETSWYVPLYKEPEKILNQKIELKMITNQKGLLVPDINVIEESIPGTGSGGSGIGFEEPEEDILYDAGIEL